MSSIGRPASWVAKPYRPPRRFRRWLLRKLLMDDRLDKTTKVQLLRARWRRDWLAWDRIMEVRARHGLVIEPWMVEVMGHSEKGDANGVGVQQDL